MKRALSLVLPLSAAVVSSAQNWSQAWTPPCGAVPSIVDSLGGFNGDPAFADFATGRFWRVFQTVAVYGVVSDPEQWNRPFVVSTWTRTSSSPSLPLAEIDRQAAVALDPFIVGIDGQGRTVWKAFLRLSRPVSLAFLRSYWISVAEEDNTSLTGGEPDFWWSTTTNFWGTVSGYPDPVLGWRKVFDPVSGAARDLAFQLFL